MDDSGGYAWTSPRLREDVQAWLDAPTSNHGWLLRGDEATPGTSKRIASRTFGALGVGDACDCPCFTRS